MKTVKLNIVMTYPVYWKETEVLYNFLQNFYDALGPDRFADNFHFLTEGRRLTMYADESFSKEWLYCMGTSSKRNRSGTFAGKFGEGFKIAALIAMRDYGMSVDMASKDWTLHVTSVPGEIDGREVEFLAYEIGERPYSDRSELVLGNVTEKLRESMHTIMDRFYYPGNRLFGKCLEECRMYSIFTLNQDLPDQNTGYVFSFHEKRGTINVPLIFCNHFFGSEEDDRDREIYSDFKNVRLILKICTYLDAEVSVTVLEYFRKFWSGNPARWSNVIRRLIMNISRNPTVIRKFHEKYSGQLVARDFTNGDWDKYKRRIAGSWFRMLPERPQYKMVMASFQLLDIDSVCSLCEKMDGFTTEREPNKSEQRRIDILKEAAQTILGDLLLFDFWPPCRILINPKAPVEGYTDLISTEIKNNRYGLKVVARGKYVYMQAYLLENGFFGKAFSVYSHELLHEYGGDTTRSFHRALYLMNEKILQNIDRFHAYEEQW